MHPFAGAGVGWHLMRLYERGENIGPDHNRLGLSLLGGAEVFLSREWTLKGEARYQWVADIPLVDPSGLAFTVGLKRYFQRSRLDRACAAPARVSRARPVHSPPRSHTITAGGTSCER